MYYFPIYYCHVFLPIETSLMLLHKQVSKSGDPIIACNAQGASL